jgi:N-acetylglucosamine kinase-like BadF-type ATPase
VTGSLPAVVAIDGGNSKTDVALVGQDGTLLALVRGAGMPGRLGDATITLLGDLISAAVKLADSEQDGVSPAVPATGPVAPHLVACVANADLPSEERQLERMLAAQGWAGSTTVANDTYAVLRAGLDDVPACGASQHWGVGVTCGTGINGMGKAPDGRTARFLALGMITGDWGGGSGLGLEAHWHAVRDEDGRGPRTALRQAIPAALGLSEPLEVAEALHTGQLNWDSLASLPPVVFEVADAGDDIARSLVLRLAEEIFLLVRSSIMRLDLTDEPVPVVLGGGIIAAANPLLMDAVTAKILAEFPAADIRVLLHAPVAGASLVGLDLAQAEVSAKRRLREQFERRTAAQR